MLSAASRIMRSAPIVACPKPRLWCVRVSVAPAKGEYSPPERDVGMLMIGREHGDGLDGLESRASAERLSMVWTLFARACNDG